MINGGTPAPFAQRLSFAHTPRGALLPALAGRRPRPDVIPSGARRPASEVEGSRGSAGGACRPAATSAAHGVNRRCRGCACSLPGEIPRLRSATRHSARDDNRSRRIDGQGSALMKGERGGCSHPGGPTLTRPPLAGDLSLGGRGVSASPHCVTSVTGGPPRAASFFLDH